MESKEQVHMFWVYILRCKDNSYYTGHTDNLEARLQQHHNRIFPSCYTATRLPLELLYSASFPSRIEALRAEKQIQGWSRKMKEALIKGDWSELSLHAKRKSFELKEIPISQPLETARQNSVFND